MASTQPPEVSKGIKNPDRLLLLLSLLLGVFAFAIVLTTHYLADWDLWAKLSIGAYVWHNGTVPLHDNFAFTTVLPDYVDHEWGAGAVFFGLLKLCGPGSLMALKLVLAMGALIFAGIAARRQGTGWNTILMLAIAAGACILPAYAPVIRSHSFTYCLFATLLLCLEMVRTTPEQATAFHRWLPAGAVILVMAAWVNLHGGFVAGLGVIAVYTGISLWRMVTGSRDFRTRALLVASAGALAVTFLNPYGPGYWSHLLPALMIKRPMIPEWQPLPLVGRDIFVAFRVLFGLVVLAAVLGWKRAEKHWEGIALLAITGYLGWHSRRHTAFFGITVLAFAGPFLLATLQMLLSRLPKLRVRPAAITLAIYGVLAFRAATVWLPATSGLVFAPIGDEPVREADILSRAKARGNLAVPFHWGSYASWRLYPRIKVSCDGRYEAVYPESTFLSNYDFFNKSGRHWDRLVREHRVDYVILDLRRKPLRPEDLMPLGYVMVWQMEEISALMARQEYASELKEVARELPTETIEPLDAALTDDWWKTAERASEGQWAGTRSDALGR